VQDSFTYRIICENLPLPVAANTAYTANLGVNLHELQLTFLWPQLPNGQLPPQPPHQTYRTMIAGQIVTNLDAGQILYFFQPQYFNHAP
jgi:hypothetical protein